MLDSFSVALIMTLVTVIEIYRWIVVIAVLITWVNPDPYNPIVQILRKLTEPVFAYVRRFIPSQHGIDFSPIVVLLAIIFVEMFLKGLLL